MMRRFHQRSNPRNDAAMKVDKTPDFLTTYIGAEVLISLFSLGIGRSCSQGSMPLQPRAEPEVQGVML